MRIRANCNSLACWLLLLFFFDSVPSFGSSESLIDSDVEEDECHEGKDAQKKGSGDVHVVLDVKWIVPKKSQNNLTK